MTAVQTSEQYDCVIIGGGPTGLFGAFFAGLRGMSTLLLEGIDRLGGQPAVLYPEKLIYDVPGFKEIRGGQLVERLIQQGASTGARFRTNTKVQHVEADGPLYRLGLSDGTAVAACGLVVATGMGAFRPRRHPSPSLLAFEGRGVTYGVQDLASLAGQRVVIVGGGDAAVDWALTILPVAAAVTVIHRRNTFRALEDSVRRLQESEATILTPYEVVDCHGDERVQSIQVKDGATGKTAVLPCDIVVVAIGYHSDLGPVGDWGLAIADRKIQVDSTMATNLERVYAAGDIVTYPGKVELIAAGFSEAAIAINHLKHDLDPEASVQPARSSHVRRRQPAK